MIGSFSEYCPNCKIIFHLIDVKIVQHQCVCTSSYKEGFLVSAHQSSWASAAQRPGWPAETSTIHSPDCEFSFREMKHYWNLKSWNSKKFCWCCCLWQLSVRQWGIRGIGGIRRRPSSNNSISREWQDSSSSLANSDNNNNRRVSEDRGSKDDLTVPRPAAGLASNSGLSGHGPAHRGRRTSTSPTWRSSPTPSLIVTKIKGDLWIIH